MEKGPQLIQKKNNILDNLKKINILDSTSSSIRPKKLKLRNDVSSLIKLSEKTNSKKVIDFPLCLSLFTNNQTINDIDSRIKSNEKNKLNLYNLKPKNFQNLKLNNIIKTKNKVISRNPNYINLNSLSPIKTNKLASFTKFSSPINKNKSSKFILKKLNYSPSNIFTQKSPIIINKIGIESQLAKLSNKFISLSNSTIDQDISIGKNIKGVSINNLNYNINFIDRKILPSIFSSTINIENLQNDNNDSKKEINKIKKKVQNDINDFEHKIDSIQNQKENNDKTENVNLNNADKKFKLNKVNTFNPKREHERARTLKRNRTNKFYFNIAIKKFDFNKSNEENDIDKKSLNKFRSNNSMTKIYDKYIEKNKSEKEISILEENKEESNLEDSLKENKNEIDKQKNIKEQKERLSRLRKSCFSNNNNIKNINKVKIDSSKVDEEQKSQKAKLKFEKQKTYVDINKSMVLTSSKKNDFKRVKTLKESYPNIFDSSKKQIKTKFYYAICKKQTINIFNKNKFLRKINEKISKTSMNNLINRKIYFQKTSMLLNIQNNVNKIINKEKGNLKIPQFNDQNSNIYYNDIYKIKNTSNYNLWRININSYYKYNCNLIFGLTKYLTSSIDYNGLTNINLSLKKKAYNRRKNYSPSRKTRKRFQTVQIRPINELKVEDEKEKDDFLVRKTKDTFKGELDWIYSPINLLSIQVLILRSEPFIENKNNNSDRKNTKNVTRNHSLNNIICKDLSLKHIPRQHSIVRKLSAFNLSVLKKTIRKDSVKEMPHGNELFLLHQKKFFKRIKRRKIKEGSTIKREKTKDDEDLINYSSNETSSNISSEDKDVDDIFYELVRYIFESKNKNFMEFFERNKKNINMNQQLEGGNSLLIISSREGNATITRFLCEQGLEINMQNNNGNTALHYAIANQLYSIADILTRFGAREDIANNKGLYPWDCIENNLE